MPADRMARSVAHEPCANLLMRLLTPPDVRLIEPHLHRVRFSPGEIIVSPDAPLTQLIFPETLMVGFSDSGRSFAQIGVVGREGIVGWSLLLGCDSSSLLGTVQMQGGTGLAIRAERLREACHISTSLGSTLLRFVHNFMTQMACTIVSNAADPIERRVARWLLMLHDRAGEDALALTHNHVGNALHVRRASVTDCLHVLEGDGLVRCQRGRIVIRDRAALEQLAGDAYGTVEAQYRRELGPFGRSA
jgi:CRP-like cAMP-binding protein